MNHRGEINLVAVPYLVSWHMVNGTIVIDKATVMGVPIGECPEHVRHEVLSLATAEIKGYEQDMKAGLFS